MQIHTSKSRETRFAFEVRFCLISLSFRIKQHRIKLPTNHYGVTEQRINAIFQKTEEKPTELHIVIFDEIDALFPKRKFERESFKKGHVNQMLSCMDGIKVRNNIIVFGLTNRLEDLDEALIRSGRFGLKIKIDVPNRKQRNEIIKVYSNRIKKTPKVKLNANLNEVLDITEKFTGADIESMFNLVYSKAFSRSKRTRSNEHYILMKDFVNSIKDLKKTSTKLNQVYDGDYDSEEEIEKIKLSEKNE